MIRLHRCDFINESIVQQKQRIYERERNYQMREYEQYKERTTQRYYKILRQLCSRLEKQGKFNEPPPKTLNGAEAVYKFINNKIDEYALQQQIKALNVPIKKSMEKDYLKKRLIEQQKEAEEARKKEYFKNMSKSLSVTSKPRRAPFLDTAPRFVRLPGCRPHAWILPLADGRIQAANAFYRTLTADSFGQRTQRQTFRTTC